MIRPGELEGHQRRGFGLHSVQEPGCGWNGWDKTAVLMAGPDKSRPTRLFQFRHGQSSKSGGDWKTVRRATYDRAAGNARLSYDLAHEIEVDRVAGGRHFSPLRFEQLQRPPTSTTKSTSRVRSRQKNRLPARPARRSRPRS